MNKLRMLFRIERIRLRRSWPLLVALVVPCTLVAFLGLIFWFSEDRVSQLGGGFQAWYQINFTVWTLFAMPMITAMIGVLAWEGELQAASWKHLFLQPVPRGAHFASKLMGQLSLALLSHLLLALCLLAGGWLIRKGAPGLDMGAVKAGLLVRLTGASLVASLPLVALHAWLPMRFRGLGISLIIALAGSWWGFRWAASSALGWLLPWGMASQVVARSLNPGGPILAMALGTLLCAGLWMALGFWDFARSEEPLG